MCERADGVARVIREMGSKRGVLGVEARIQIDRRVERQRKMDGGAKERRERGGEARWEEEGRVRRQRHVGSGTTRGDNKQKVW